MLLESIMPLVFIQEFGYPPWQMIIIYGGFLLSSILMQIIVFGRLINWVSDVRNVSSFLCVYGAVLTVLIPLVNSLPYSIVFVCLAGLCIMNAPSLIVMCSFLAQGQYGTVLGLRASVGSLARALSPLVNGQLFDLYFPPVLPSKMVHMWPFFLSSFLLLVSSMLIRLANVSRVKKSDTVLPEAGEQTKLIN
jgi:MFS family permease